MRKLNTVPKNKSKRLQVYKRAQVSGQVFIHDEDHLFIASLSNISAGGFFVDRLVDLTEGQVVRVVIKSPRLEKPIQARGTVVRIEKTDRQGTAVEFTSISSQARELIQACVFESKVETALKVA
jgi:c-di-GMP-binding flagellar brake protein YcgR